MIDNTIHQELEELRLEIENLKEQKKQNKDTKTIEQEKSIEDFTSDVKDSMNELLQTIKKDYKDMSPVTAIGLFALGVIFGRATSRR